MATMPTSRAAALETLQLHPTDRVLFLKHMANHLEGLFPQSSMAPTTDT